MADDTTVTIAIRANVEAFKKSMAEARKSVKDTGKAVKEDAGKMTESLKEAGGKKSGFSQLAESIKGVSPALDGVIGSVSEMKERIKGAGRAGKLAMAAVGAAVAGLALGIGVMLGKALMETTGKLAKMADPVRFDKAASEMKESLRTLKTALGELASPVFEVMAKAVSAVAKGLTWIVEKIAQLAGALQGLLGIGHKVNQTINGMADAMDEAGAAADAGLASFDKLNTLNIGEMGDMSQAERMGKAMDEMRKKGEELRKKIADALKPVAETIDKIKDLANIDLGQIWVNFKDSAVNAWQNITAWAGSSWEGIKLKASEIWAGIGETGNNIWKSITGTAVNAWESLKNHIAGIFGTLSNSLKSMFGSVVNFFKSAWDKTFGAIKSAIKWVTDKVEWLMGKINGLKNAVGNAVQGAKDWVSSKVQGVKNALGFAKGGVFQPNSPQLVMVGDNKTEPEVIAPRSMIMDAMRQVIGEMGGGSQHAENITLMIDGKTLARYTYDDFESEGRRRGTGAMI